MHGPCASCRGARSAPCSTDCMLAVVHGSVRFSYLLSAETFPLCFDGGEGKHKSLLSRSLPPSPSRRSFSCSPFLQQRCKNEPRSSCTWSPFAFDACASAPAAAVPMHGVRGDGKSAISANTLQKIPRSTYMMAKSWQLKALNLDQCEPLRECVLPAWSAEDTGKCSKSGEGFQISLCTHKTKFVLDEN